MRVERQMWIKGGGWQAASLALGSDAQWVLVFASRAVLEEESLLEEVRARYPNALLTGCSTAGEIHGTEVLDDSLTLTAVSFDRTLLRKCEASVASPDQSHSAGQSLAEGLIGNGLQHVFVLSDGLHVNGTELVQGLRANLPAGVQVTGGLAGDGDQFKKTLVMSNLRCAPGLVVAIGFYGKALQVGYGSLGGWDPFGPDRLITRARGNVLYELDGKSALDLYKTYLGEHAAGLPATGLLFPLCVAVSEDSQSVVRTILSVDEKEKSLTFAGDVLQGAYARLMRANLDRLIDGAVSAAKTSLTPLGAPSAELAILISCVGRKLVLKQRVEEEVEAVRDILGPSTPLTGFYSYGEIAPFKAAVRCELHNQTMTITVFREAV